MKKIGIIFLVMLFLGIGVLIPKVFINDLFGEQDVTPLTQDGKRQYICSGIIHDEDPRLGVELHSDNPIQRLLIMKIALTGVDRIQDKYIYSAYTLFGILLSVAEVDCKTGGIQTIRGL